MTAITDRIAAEHHYLPRRRYKLCACGDVLGVTETMRHHVAVKVEAAVREQVARDIEAVRGEHLRWYGNQTLSLAARIARGAS